MSPDRQELEDNELRGTNAFLVFGVVAFVVLTALFAVSRLAAGEHGPGPAHDAVGNVDSAPAAVGVTSVTEPAAQSAIGVTQQGAGSPPVSPQAQQPNAPTVSEARPALESEGASPSLPQTPSTMLPAPTHVWASSPPPAIGARAYAIAERSCGAVLWGKNEHERLPPASLTKIMTALVVNSRASADEMVDIDVSGEQMAKRGSSVMGIEPHMDLSVGDLLYGLFLPSGNDAALALAEHVGGETGNFVNDMNDLAGRLGMYNTHFTNPHGLDSSGLYSTAFDLAIAGRALLDDPYLSQVSSTPQYRPSWDRPALKNGNKLLQMYPGAFGVKIGYTTRARQTIVAAAERDGRQVVVTLLGSDNRYADTVTLFDWAFTKAPPAC